MVPGRLETVRAGGEPVHDYRIRRSRSIAPCGEHHRRRWRCPRSIPRRRSRLVSEQQSVQLWRRHLVLATRPFKEETMIIVSKHQLFVGTALLALTAGALYGCKDFLTDSSRPQGTLDAGTLANRTGVEGTLIGAYRSLDCASSSSAWGCAASNWVFGSVASDDSYKGSDGGDQPPINDIEGYRWGTPRAEEYLNGKWAQVYEGVVRSNSAIRLLKQVLTESPGEFSPFPGLSDLIEGEAVFLRAHYHF